MRRREASECRALPMPLQHRAAIRCPNGHSSHPPPPPLPHQHQQILFRSALDSRHAQRSGPAWDYSHRAACVNWIGQCTKSIPRGPYTPGSAARPISEFSRPSRAIRVVMQNKEAPSLWIVAPPLRNISVPSAFYSHEHFFLHRRPRGRCGCGYDRCISASVAETLPACATGEGVLWSSTNAFRTTNPRCAKSKNARPMASWPVRLIGSFRPHDAAGE